MVLPGPTAAGEGQSLVNLVLTVEQGHRWTAPFGLGRVGRPLEAVVEIASGTESPRECLLVEYRDGKEIGRRPVMFMENSKPKGHFGRVVLDRWPSEVAVLLKKAPQAALVEVARAMVNPVEFEAEAVARPDQCVNPVDLGAILVPAEWLLLAGGQKAEVEVAAISRNADCSSARVNAWYDSAVDRKTTAPLTLERGRKAQAKVSLEAATTTLERDVLHVNIVDGDGTERWRKDVPVMLVPKAPKWPAFEAVETILRYDAPISVREADGKYTSINYSTGWNPRLYDVVVAMPNGSRFVFWRGACYIPFWAGVSNTGLCYEWAESRPPSDACDAVEPLMDKELRYSRVQIVESTAARVHVRWSYQSCDFHYKTWGDSAVEDFYFYPDGFGTRVVTLQSDPQARYELSELIVLTPQSMYPLSVLPANLVDILFLDGQKRTLTFPFYGQSEKMQSRGMPAIFRIRLSNDEPTAAIYFSPRDESLPQAVYGPFDDRGQIVTPVYWGSHWPLARGNATGGAINDRVSLTPAHNSIVTWGYFHRPTPLRTAQVETRDTLDRTKPMLVQTWAWLIGMTDADDKRLCQWAESFAQPPTLNARGAILDGNSYYAEDRRALCLKVEDDSETVEIAISPAIRCVNPVFELQGAPKTLAMVSLGGQVLDSKQFAWDGQTLWLNADLDRPVTLRLEFSH